MSATNFVKYFLSYYNKLHRTDFILENKII